jgi:hypothetical protein
MTLTLCMRERLGGELWWTRWYSNEPLRTYGVGLWKSIKRVWASTLVILDLRWEMAPRLASSMICNVGI